MIRVQIYLEEEQDLWLEGRARALGTSKAALIREGIRGLRDREAPIEQEPLLELIGMIKADPEGATDVSERHDWYLAEWEYRQNHPLQDG